MQKLTQFDIFHDKLVEYQKIKVDHSTDYQLKSAGERAEDMAAMVWLVSKGLTREEVCKLPWRSVNKHRKRIEFVRYVKKKDRERYIEKKKNFSYRRSPFEVIAERDGGINNSVFYKTIATKYRLFPEAMRYDESDVRRACRLAQENQKKLLLFSEEWCNIRASK